MPKRPSPSELRRQNPYSFVGHAMAWSDGVTAFCDNDPALTRELLARIPESRRVYFNDGYEFARQEREPCGCPREGRPDGDGWHLDDCPHRQIELDQPYRQNPPSEG